MQLWAKTIGGILKVNDFTDFLANYQTSRLVEDPTRTALAILAASKPGDALKPVEWAEIAVQQGVVKTLITNHERDTEVGRARAIGVILSKHLGETFTATTDAKRMRVKLEGGLRRWRKGEDPDKRYVFTILQEEDLPVE